MTRRGQVIITVSLAALHAGLFACAAWLRPHPRLLWNTSASAPLGLYRLQGAGQPVVGDLVAIMPPPDLARFLSERHYLAPGLPLLKRVAAVPGQRICRRNANITVEGKPVATALSRDRAGRFLPAWRGCRIVSTGTLFLINAAPDSLDSRYFGALPTSQLLGRAHPVLTRDCPGKPLRWRGFAGPSSSITAQKEHMPCK